MGSFYMEATQINYRRDETLKTVDQKLQELSEESAVDTDIAPVFSKTATYNPGDLVYYKNKLYVCVTQHNGAWAAADFTASTVSAEVSSLRSGLTNVDVALSVPENTGKNVLPLTLASLKAINSDGTWADNVYTKNSRTFTVSTNSSGYVTSIVVNGTDNAEQDTTFILARVTELNNMLDGAYILNGCPSGGNTNYRIYIGSDVIDKGDGVLFNTPLTGSYSGIRVKSDYTASNLTFYPMIRPATITDPTFTPYIPSVESRIEAVESAMVKTKEVTIAIGTDKYDDYYYATNTHGITGTIISAYIIGVTQNHAAFLNYCNSTTIRVCSPISGVNVVVCVSYIDS